MRTEDMNYAFYNKGPTNVIWLCAYSLWTLLMESWTSSEHGPGLFLSALTVICNSIKSQSDIFYFLFTSGQNHIKILLVSRRERCWRWGCTQRVCVHVCVYMCVCVTAVRKNSKPDGISFFVLLCFLVHSPLCVCLSLSVFEFGIRILFPAYIEMNFISYFWRIVMNDIIGYSKSWSSQTFVWYLPLFLFLFLSLALLLCICDTNKQSKAECCTDPVYKPAPPKLSTWIDPLAAFICVKSGPEATC